MFQVEGDGRDWAAADYEISCPPSNHVLRSPNMPRQNLLCMVFAPSQADP